MARSLASLKRPISRRSSRQGRLFGLRVIQSKVLAAPVVLDSKANGKLYLSPISLARFEENAGRTNTSLVRLEGHAGRRAHCRSDSDRRKLGGRRKFSDQNRL